MKRKNLSFNFHSTSLSVAVELQIERDEIKWVQEGKKIELMMLFTGCLLRFLVVSQDSLALPSLIIRWGWQKLISRGSKLRLLLDRVSDSYATTCVNTQNEIWSVNQMKMNRCFSLVEENKKENVVMSCFEEFSCHCWIEILETYTTMLSRMSVLQENGWSEIDYVYYH